MKTAEEHLRQFYDDFAAGQFSRLRRRLASRVMYLTLAPQQCQAWGHVMGPTKLMGILRVWHECFSDVKLQRFRIQPNPGRIGEVSTAEHFFEVKYSLVAEYVRSLPGLEEVAPAYGRVVGVRIIDHVWLNGVGRVIRINRSFDISTLR